MAKRGGKRLDPAREMFWRRTVRQQQRSGLPVRDFCRREGLRDWNFQWWRQELARCDHERSAAPSAEPAEAGPSFLPMRVVAPEAVAPRTAPPIEIVFPAGPTVRVPFGFDPRTPGRHPGRAGRPPTLRWPPTVRIYLCAGSTDMRKGFDSLASLVESALALDPFSGHLFVFRSRRGDRIKVLWWDRDVYCLWYKRLEKGCFRFPTDAVTPGATHVEVKAADLLMILDGVDLGSVRRQRRYSRETIENPR